MSGISNWYKKSFRNKLVIAILAIFFTIYFIILQWAYLAISSELLHAAKKESTSTSAILVMALYRSFDLTTDKREILSFLHGSKQYRDNLTLIRVFDIEQRIISSTNIEEIGRQLVRDNHYLPLGNLISSDVIQNLRQLVILHPISAGHGNKNKPVGFIEVHYDISALDDALTHLQWFFVVGGLIMAILITLALTRIASNMTHPMRTLFTAMKQVEGDRLDIQVPVLSEDEVGYLSGKFNAMIASLRLSRSRLDGLLQASSRFVPAEFLQMLGYQEIGQVRLGDAKHQTLSVMFVDIRDFTRLSSHLAADQVLAFINQINCYLIPAIENHNGFVDKFIGDAIMAIFPEKPDDALLACNDLFVALAKFNQDTPLSYIPQINIGVGINSGDVIIGTVGSDERMDTTVIGDTVNLAARMEGLTKSLNAKVLIPQGLYQQLKQKTIEDCQIESYGDHGVKGIEQPLAIYGVKN